MDQNQNPYQPQNGQYGYQGGQDQGYQQNGQYGSPYQTQQSSVSFELPQQSPYEQYYSAPAKKKLNPLVIVIPAAAAIIIALIIALIIVLSGSGSKNNSNGGSGGYVGGGGGGISGGESLVSDDNNGDSHVSDDGGDSAEDDYGIEYDAKGNPVFTQQTLNNGSLTGYNSRNPFDISVNIYAAGDANKLAAVETADKKKIQRLIVSNLFSANDIDFDDSVDMIVGEPVKITYMQQELMQEYEIVYSLPDSLVKSSAHYPTLWSGIDRFAVLYVDENDEMVVDNGDVVKSSGNSMTINGHDGSAYLVMLDGDAMYYGLGLDPGLFEDYGDSTESESESTTTPADSGNSSSGGNSSGGGSSGGQGQDVFTHSTHTSDGRFICEYLGIGANLGSGWTFDTDDEIADKNGIMEASDEALRKKLESGNVVYDMHADSDSYDYVSLTYTPMYTTLDDYVDIHMENWTESMESIYDDVTVTRENVRFAGLNATRVYTECNTKYSSTYDYSFYIDHGDCIAIISIFAFDKDDLDSIAASFYAL